MLHRTQILLEDWQHQALKRMAEKEGRSLGALVRALLTQQLRRRRKNATARLAVIEGLGEDRGAAGRDHDRYLYGKGKRR
jgi:predicted DNA-binding ribbon-helix-helix protein